MSEWISGEVGGATAALEGEGGVGGWCEAELDPVQLGELRRLGLVARVVPLLLQRLEGEVAALRAGLEVGEARALRSSAHRLAGSAALAGARSLAARARAIEDAAADEDLTAAAAALAGLEAAAPRIVAALESVLRRGG